MQTITWYDHVITLYQGWSEAKAKNLNPALKNDDFDIGFSMVIRYKTGPSALYDAPTLLYTIWDVFGVLYKGVNSGRRWVVKPYAQVCGPALYFCFFFFISPRTELRF